MKRIAAFEIIGTFFIIIAGSLFHFVYEWLNYWKPSALVFPVNESTWEHLKLAFWPGIFFAAIEYAFVRNKVKNFFVAKIASFCIMPVTIIVLFYLYAGIIGHNLLFLDISVFIIAVILGQIAGYRILKTGEYPQKIRTAAAIVFAVIFLAFVLFTFFPPGIFLFEDPLTGGYGIMR